MQESNKSAPRGTSQEPGESLAPRLIEQGREAFERNFTDELLGTASSRSWQELTGIVNRLPWTAVTRQGTVAPEEATDLLAKACFAVEAELKRWIVGYSPMRWFWMLRRVPRRTFKGTLSTTLGYDRSLAHVLAAQSPTTETRTWPDGLIRFPLEGAVYRRVARFCEGVRCLSDLHKALRWAGKGAGFKIREGRNPQEVVGSELRAAVELYDSRIDEHGSPFARAGTVVANIGETPLSGNAVLLVQDLNDEVEVPISQPAIYADGPIRVGANFLPIIIGVDALEEIANHAAFTGTEAWTPECWALLAMLRMALVFVHRHKTGLQGVLQNGYLAAKTGVIEAGFDDIIKHDELAARCSKAAHVASGQALLALLVSRMGQSWPLIAGPVAYTGSGVVCLDLSAASDRLNSLLQYPKVEGGAANVRSQHFELATQSIVDKTPWQPDVMLRMVRGRTLSRAGRTITDVDAIGQRNGTLLLISCKSLIYSAESDRGDYRVVRNAASLAVNAAEDWIAKCADLISGPGDSFDFTQFRKVIAVVCTPHAVFVPIGVATEDIANGLRRVVPVNELTAWLRAT